MEDSSNYSIASEIGYIGDESSREDGASPFNQNAIPEDGHSGGHGVGDASVDLDAHNEHADHNDFDESYMDFVEAEDQKEALDEFCKIMGMTFGSEVEAYMFYNSYAKKHGFSIRKGKVKRAKGTRKIRFRRFVCSRSGKRQEKLLTMNGRTRRLRAETRCNAMPNSL